jgi:hypothetical protein
MKPLIDRRAFAAAGLSAAALALAATTTRAGVSLEAAVAKATLRHAGKTVAPIYIVAYIEPDSGQEALVARYPLAIVPQSIAPKYMRWRDTVRSLNPEIVLLGYQMTSLEPNSSGRGPGHDLMAHIQKSWVVSPGGTQPTVETPPRRLYDMRRDEWKAAFLDACSATLKSYPYDGLFLDQCSVFGAHAPNSPLLRGEMRDHLQGVLLELRNRHPNALIIGNSSYQWKGLNGAMSEDRNQFLRTELAPAPGQASPALNLGLMYLKEGIDNPARIEAYLIQTLSMGAFFTALHSTKRATWFPIFDRVLEIAKRDAVTL